MYWLTSRNSILSIENKLKIYKTIIKPIWTYKIPLWGTAAMSNINKLESLQSKILKTIVDARWYVRNQDIGKDLKIPTFKEEIVRYTETYKGRMATHPNQLTANASKTHIERRLKRNYSTNLTIEINQLNSKMVFHWGQPSTCYLAIKLEKFTKFPAGQIVKCQSVTCQGIKYLHQ